MPVAARRSSAAVHLLLLAGTMPVLSSYCCLLLH
jgi:hypothetical protein